MCICTCSGLRLVSLAYKGDFNTDYEFQVIDYRG